MAFSLPRRDPNNVTCFHFILFHPVLCWRRNSYNRVDFRFLVCNSQIRSFHLDGGDSRDIKIQLYFPFLFFLLYADIICLHGQTHFLYSSQRIIVNILVCLFLFSFWAILLVVFFTRTTLTVFLCFVEFYFDISIYLFSTAMMMVSLLKYPMPTMCIIIRFW